MIMRDNAFGLKPHLIKSYSSQNLLIDQSVFNRQLSRTRRITQDVFGICDTRFLVLRRPIIASSKSSFDQKGNTCSSKFFNAYH